jgi:hypothetical protein
LSIEHYVFVIFWPMKTSFAVTVTGLQRPPLPSLSSKRRRGLSRIFLVAVLGGAGGSRSR